MIVAKILPIYSLRGLNQVRNTASKPDAAGLRLGDVDTTFIEEIIAYSPA
jgi:hypothetical protein